MFTLTAKSTGGRLIVLGVVIGAVALAWFGVKWQIANMLGDLTSPGQDNAMELAQAAISLSPRDPLPRLLLAEAAKEGFSEDSIEASIRGFEDAIRRTPYDYRPWIELGRVYEQAQRVDDAERAFRHAIDLAPGYTYPQWQIGNFYLRRDRVDEAFAYLTRATQKSYVYRGQVFALAWDYFDHDAARVEHVAANTPETRVNLAAFFAERGAASDALRVWNSIPEDVRARHSAMLKYITQRTREKRNFRETLEFAKQAGIDADANFETVTNGSFEKFFGNPETTIFGWRINRSESRLELIPDSSVHSDGQRSLKLNFKSYNRPDLVNIYQLIAVHPAAKYRLTFMLRTENLRANGEPIVLVVDAKNDVVLAQSPRFPVGTHDWQQMSIEFSVPENSDGVELRTVRENCGEICLINGIIWYDAFKLERL